MKPSIYLILFLFFTSNQILLSQNQYDSNIIVSEEDLVSLIQKLNNYQNKNITNKKERKSTLESRLENIILKQSDNENQDFYVEEEINNYTYNDRLSHEIENVDDRLNQLIREYKNQQQGLSKSSNNESESEIRNIIFTKGNQTEEKTTPKAEQQGRITEVDNEEKLLKTVDSLLNVRDNLESKLYENLENNAEDINEEDNSKIDSLLQRQKELVAQLNNNSNEDSSDVSVELEIDEDMLEKLSYSVFFENNSHSLDAKYKSNLDKVVSFLESEPNVKVVLNAYASKSGNADYNLKLSMLRADEVKSYLKSKSISAERILSDYHGSDPVKEASVARRVEISYKIK